MASTAALPPGLRHQLTAAAHRIRRLRFLQGISLLALALVLIGGAAMLLDVWLDLPRIIRLVLFTSWASVGISVMIFGLLRPLCRRLDPEGLAAAIEDRYPDLGERLTSTVELTGVADPHHGAPVFVNLLIQETEARTQRLDVLGAFPSRRVAWLSGMALAGLILAALPALLWPTRYANLGQRFLFSWQTPARVAPYRFDVTPGNTVAATGRPLAFTVRVHRLDDKAALPRTCTWVRTDSAGNTVRRPMQVDRSDAFSFKLDQVLGDFRYHIEARDVASPDFQVTAIQPVELAGDSPTVTITPRRYAQANVETQTVLGVSDLTALQYSQMTFDFRFTRPAVAAYLEWLAPAGKGEADDPMPKHPIVLSPDATAGRLQLPATADGTFRVVLEAEQGIRTELEPRSLIVKPDQPPAFVKVTGHDELKAVHPYESLPLDLDLADDVAVDRAELEYRVNDAPSVLEPITLEGRGTRQARGRYTFQLAGKVKEGDLLRYRLKATDNRDVPEAGLKPNVTFYPPEDHGQARWRTLKIARTAVPVKQQEITAQHEELERKRDAIQKKVQEELAGLKQLREETRRQLTLDPLQAKALARLREQNRDVQKSLNDLARDADAIPELAPLADQAQELANQEMRRSDKELQQAAKEDQAEVREHDLAKADTELRNVSRKLEEMRRQNEAVARARLDQMQLETLANRQEQLAQRTAAQAAADPVKDAMAKDKNRELKQEQQELAGELARQEQKNDSLRKALDAARAEELRQLAERARKLADAERDLAQASRQAEQKRQQVRLAALARKQQELAERAKSLAQETERPARAAQAMPFKPDQAQKAAEALKQGNANQALQNQDQAAQELDRIASKLEQAVAQAADPRERARQLARAQEGLQDQLRSETRKPDAAESLPQRVRKLQKEQEALHKAVQQLSVPAANVEAHKHQQSAAEQTAKAAQALEKGDPRQAEARMEEARRNLNQLAHQLPSLAERRAQALRELAELRKQQQEVAAGAEKAVREAVREKPADHVEKLKKNLSETAKRQAAIAERLEKLDTPNQEAQRKQTGEAVKKALKDLHEARAKAINPSQHEAQRQLERLENALTAQKPAAPRTEVAHRSEDMPQGMPSRAQVNRARQLAQRQRELQAEVLKAVKTPPTPAETAAQRAQQQELRQQTGELTQNLSRLSQEMQRAPQAQQQVRQATHLGQQAQDAMQRAQDQVRQGQSEPARNTQQQAAQALDQAARMAEQAANMTSPAKDKPASEGQAEMATAAKTGQELQKAQGAMQKAQQQLGQGQNQSAQAAMQQAAQALQQVAQQMAAAQQPGKPAANTQVSKMGASGQGRPDASLFGKELKQYAGKSWGELPGELRTKILQDMKARYGEDYARIIKLYFEELADRKP
jgi:hypothetical protein